MKFVLILLVVCVAMAAAAPQFFTGYGFPYANRFVAPYYPTDTKTVVAGPTVVNGVDGRFTYPGFVGTTYF